MVKSLSYFFINFEHGPLTIGVGMVNMEYSDKARIFYF